MQDKMHLIVQQNVTVSLVFMKQCGVKEGILSKQMGNEGNEGVFLVWQLTVLKMGSIQHQKPRECHQKQRKKVRKKRSNSLFVFADDRHHTRSLLRLSKMRLKTDLSWLSLQGRFGSKALTATLLCNVTVIRLLSPDVANYHPLPCGATPTPSAVQ